MKHLLSDEDGWYAVKDHPQQHYFFKTVSLCKLYRSIPDDATHDNDPALHCDLCRKKQGKLMAVGESLAGRKLNARDVMNLLDILEKIDLNKGLSMKVRHGENITAVLGKPDGKSEKIIEGPLRDKSRKKRKKIE